MGGGGNDMNYVIISQNIQYVLFIKKQQQQKIYNRDYFTIFFLHIIAIFINKYTNICFITRHHPYPDSVNKYINFLLIIIHFTNK